MRAEAPRPSFRQDTGISSGVPGIQDQTAQSVGGERSEYQQEQQTSLQAAPEIPPRPELVQQFISQVSRWGTVGHIVCPEYNGHLRLILYPTEEGYAILQKGQKLDEDTPAIHIEGGLSIESDKGRAAPDDPYIASGSLRKREFSVEFSCFETEADTRRAGFIDPYNNRPMLALGIGMLDTQFGEERFQLYVAVKYGDVSFEEQDGEAVTYYEPNRRKGEASSQGEIRTTSYFQGTQGLIGFYPTLLSGDVDAHAKALMDFANSLIPQVNPQLPEPPAAGEQ